MRTHTWAAVALLSIGCWGKIAMSEDTLVFVGQASDLEGRPATAVFRIDTDGSNRRQITGMTGGYAGVSNRIQSPSVSPLGRKLVYFRWPRLHVCDWDGSNDVCVTPVAREHFHPAWSPDGKTIAFASDRNDDAEIYLVDADGANPRNLTWRGMTAEITPAWSPDGKQLVFASQRGKHFQILVMDRFGRDQRAITDGSFDCHYPAWSPDGRRIAFTGDRNGNFDLYLIDIDGGNLARLTDDDAWNGQPAWSPDGARLAFTSTRDGSGDIWIMDVATRQARNVTQTPDEDERFPAWVPTQTSDTPLTIPALTEADAESLSPFEKGLLGFGPITAARVEATALPRPRLFFRSEDLPELRAKLNRAPYAEAWTAFLKRCEPLLDPGKPLLPDHLGKVSSNAGAARHPLYMAFNLGFAYQVTGDQRYGDAGARLLAEICTRLREYHPKLALNWPTGPAEYLPAAFDWLHGAMTDEQLRVVRGVLLNSTERLYRGAQQSAVGFSPMAEDGAFVGNMTLISAGYLGPGALALAGEPGYDPRWLDAAVHMLQRVVETWYDANGCPHCGHAYFNWAGNMAIPFFMSCVRNNLGDNLAGQNIKNWPTWMAMTARDGLTRTINMGDSYAGPPSFNVAYLDLYRDNPLVDLLWDKTGEAVEPKPDVADLLWWRPVVADPAAVEALPRNLFFPKGGYMVFRSGFGPDDPMLTFSAPQYGGHSHAEGGAFCLYGYGMDFAVEAGNGNGAAHAHNNVLINGRGRAYPWIAPAQPVIEPGPRTELGATATADFTQLFAATLDGHGAYAYPSPWYPVRKAVRHVAMIHHPEDGIPPYFLIADDMDANGATNRYEFLLTGQRDNRLEPGDHQVVMRRQYRGAWFESGAHNPGDDAVTFPIEIPADGTYTIRIYVRGHKGGFRLSAAGRKVEGHASSEATRNDCWQWQRLEGKNDAAPLAFALEKGPCILAVHHATERYGGNFARVLLVPDATYQPWGPDADDAPPGSVLITAEDAEAVGQAWIPHAAEPKATEPRGMFAFLNPEPLHVEPSIYRYRTRHFGQVLNHLPRVTAVREAVNPRFLVLAYPHRADMASPAIVRHGDAGTLKSVVTWPEAVDTIEWTFADGRNSLLVRRTRPDGTEHVLPIADKAGE